MWSYPTKRKGPYNEHPINWTTADLDELAEKSDHRIRVEEVRIYDRYGTELFAPHFEGANAVTIKFLHSKADQIG